MNPFAAGEMESLTRIYTDKGIEFLKANREKPFLLYMAHTMVHSIIDASPEFKGKSKGGLYADAVEELDYHTDRLLLGKNEAGRDDYFYFCKSEMHGVRKGKWKLILPDREKFYGYVDDRGSGTTELYDLDADIGETKNLAEEHPEVVEELVKYSKSFEWPEKPAETNIGLPRKK